MCTGWVTLGVYSWRILSVALALCSKARFKRIISPASPCTRMTWGGLTMSRKSEVWGKSAWAEKEMASTEHRRASCSKAAKLSSNTQWLALGHQHTPAHALTSVHSRGGWF